MDDWVNVPHNSNINLGERDFSVSLWVKKMVGSDTYLSILYKNIWGDIDGPGFTLTFRETSPNIKGAIGNGSATLASSGSYILDTNWYHVVFVRRQGDKLKIYLNGALNAQSGENDIMGDISNNQDISIGRDRPGINPGGPERHNYLKGFLDNIHIYSRALSDAEIQAIYNATK